MAAVADVPPVVVVGLPSRTRTGTATRRGPPPRAAAAAAAATTEADGQKRSAIPAIGEETGSYGKTMGVVKFSYRSCNDKSTVENEDFD